MPPEPSSRVLETRRNVSRRERKNRGTHRQELRTLRLPSRGAGAIGRTRASVRETWRQEPETLAEVYRTRRREEEMLEKKGGTFGYKLGTFRPKSRTLGKKSQRLALRVGTLALFPPGLVVFPESPQLSSLGPPPIPRSPANGGAKPLNLLRSPRNLPQRLRDLRGRDPKLRGGLAPLRGRRTEARVRPVALPRCLCLFPLPPRRDRRVSPSTGEPIPRPEPRWAYPSALPPGSNAATTAGPERSGTPLRPWAKVTFFFRRQGGGSPSFPGRSTLARRGRGNAAPSPISKFFRERKGGS